MIEQDANQPGDPERGIRAVLAAMAQTLPRAGSSWAARASTWPSPPWEAALKDIRSSEALSRGADFPAA